VTQEISETAKQEVKGKVERVSSRDVTLSQIEQSNSVVGEYRGHPRGIALQTLGLPGQLTSLSRQLEKVTQ
jgi:hypothetical protein